MIRSFPSRPRNPVADARRVPWRISTLLIALWATACESPVAPAACGPLPQVTVNVGETSSVAACFNDANGDVLTYTAASSNPAVATASISGTSITVTGIVPGNTTVTVTARDPEGLQGQSSFAVTVPNRAPQPRGTMPNVTVQAGRTATVEASQYFSEPDGEAMTYAAGSSDAEVASVSVAGSTITVTAEAKGGASITVTARDPGGLSATQSFRFTVPNRPPSPVGAIGAQTIEVGQSVTLDVAGSFTDPDGDALTYTAASSIAAVARTRVAGSTVTITAAGPGTTTVTITASDDERATATQRMSVTVPQPNRAPRRVGSIPSRTIAVGERATVNVSQYFSDPDGDALTYSATSTNSGVARASVSGSTVTITGAGAGSATITVTARDPGGLSATQQARVTVSQANRAPRAVGTIPSQTISAGGRATVNASQYFSDPDGDALTYSATSSNSSVSRATASGSTVTITGVSAGSATITVTARDPGRLSATQRFSATVGSSGAPDLTVPTVTPTSVTGSPGDTVRATFTIRNSGTAASAATTVRVLISSDANISRSDREIGDFRLRALTASETLTRQQALILGATEGTRYWGLCVDTVSGESDTRNNCSQGVRVTVRSSSACTTDLGTVLDGRSVRRTGSWDGSCPSVHYSDGSFARYYSFTLSERLSVTIDLTSPSVDTFLALRRGGGTGSSNAVESDDDGGAGTNSRIVRTLAPGTYTIEATTFLGGRTGPFTLTLAVGGGSSGADLVFTGVSPRTQTVPRGDSVRATFTIRNNGTVASAATTIRAYASTNSTISTTDTELGTVSLRSIPPNSELRYTISWRMASNASLGTIYWGLCITSDNCSPSVRLTVTASSSQSSTKAASSGSADALLRSLTRSNIELQGAVPRIEPVHVPKDTRTKGTRPRSDSNVVIGATIPSSAGRE